MIPRCPIHDAALDPATGCDHCTRDLALLIEQEQEIADACRCGHCIHCANQPYGRWVG